MNSIKVFFNNFSSVYGNISIFSTFEGQFKAKISGGECFCLFGILIFYDILELLHDF